MTTVAYQAPGVQPMVQPMVQPGMQPVMQTMPIHQPNRGTVPGYAAKTSIWLGALQITIGSLCFILQIVAIAINASLDSVGTGIWCGVFYVIAGAFGVAAGRRKSKCMIVTHMVMSIIAACFTTIHLTFSSIGAASDNRYYIYSGYGYGSSYTTRTGPYAVNLMLVLLALAEGVVAIIASAISCHGLCCTSAPPSHGQVLGGPGRQITYIQTPQGPQQVVVLSGGQQSVMQQQPMQYQIKYPQQQPHVQSGYPQQQPPVQAGQPPPPGVQQPPPGQMYQPGYTPQYDPPAYQEAQNNPAALGNVNPQFTEEEAAFNPNYKS